MTSDELKQLKALQLPLGTRSAKAARRYISKTVNKESGT